MNNPETFVARSSMSKKRAAVVGKLLSKIASRHSLTPEVVVAEARSAKSPLHAFFEWDDSEAAMRYRLVQAAWLIRSVHITVGDADTPTTTRAFVRITDDEDQSRYVTIKSALARKDWAEEVLADAVAELKAFRQKYATLRSLFAVFDEIDKLSTTK